MTISIPEMLLHNYLGITAGFLFYTDARANYFLCQGCVLLLNYKPIEKLCRDNFIDFDERKRKLLQYFKLLSIARLYYDELDKEKKDQNIINSKTFFEIAKLQSNLPLIYENIWEILAYIIANTSLCNGYYKEYHFKGYRDRMRKLDYKPGGFRPQARSNTENA